MSAATMPEYAEYRVLDEPEFGIAENPSAKRWRPGGFIVSEQVEAFHTSGLATTSDSFFYGAAFATTPDFWRSAGEMPERELDAYVQMPPICVRRVTLKIASRGRARPNPILYGPED
ncbi:MAG: hypothetical protein ACYC35_06625 [Pirellulales bacterium]